MTLGLYGGGHRSVQLLASCGIVHVTKPSRQSCPFVMKYCAIERGGLPSRPCCLDILQLLELKEKLSVSVQGPFECG